MKLWTIPAPLTVTHGSRSVWAPKYGEIRGRSSSDSRTILFLLLHALFRHLLVGIRFAPLRVLTFPLSALIGKNSTFDLC